MSEPDLPGVDAIGEAFGAAVALAPPERADYLARLDETDPDLASRLRLLLEHDATPPGWLRDSAVSPPADPEVDLPPPAIPGFEILGVLGVGGMGIVYKARQLEPDRLVAIKTIRPELLDARRRELFQREIAALARLRHPAIAHIYAAGMDRSGGPPRPWFAMELVEATPLLAHFAARRTSRADRLRLLARVAEAMAHAHAIGIIHRDLKPSNIVVDALGQPRILDFGIARAIDACGQSTDRTATLTGVGIGGTVPYLAPEQLGVVEGQEVDARADIHALGVIAFEAIAGRLPYDGISGAPVVRALGEFIAQSPRRLRSLDPRVPQSLDDLVASALARDPAKRPASASALADALEKAANEHPQAVRSSHHRRGSQPRLWLGALASLGVAISLGLIVGGGLPPNTPASGPRADAAGTPMAPEMEALAALDALLTADNLPPDADGLAALADLSRAALEASDAPELQRARWHLAIGNAAIRLGNWRLAIQQVGHAMPLLPLPESGGLPERHMLIALRARVLAAQGNPAGATVQFERARSTAESRGDHADAADYALDGVQVFLARGEPAAAATLASTAIDHADRAGEPALLALAHAALAHALHDQAGPEEAAEQAAIAEAHLERLAEPSSDRIRTARESLRSLRAPTTAPGSDQPAGQTSPSTNSTELPAGSRT